MKMKSICGNCGGDRFAKKLVDSGYLSARELGRPRGGKGKDVGWVASVCAACDSTSIVEIVEPCFICQNSNPTEEINMLGRNQEVTGMFEWVPELPNWVNLCSNSECGKELDRRITEIMSTTFFE